MRNIVTTQTPVKPAPTLAVRALARLLAILSIVLFALLLTVKPAQAIEYRNLVLICRNVVIPQLGYDLHLNDGEVAAARNAFENTWPNRIKQLSGGQVTMRNTVVVVDDNITSCWKLRDSAQRPCPWPEDMPTQVLQDYCRQGRYDAVINYNANPEFQYVTSGWFDANAADTSWICLNKTSDFDPTHDPMAGWTHEWLHSWETYYYAYSHWDGGPNAGVHDGGAAGYTADDDGMNFWWAWYRDLMMGRLKNGSAGKGFGPGAWNQFGTPRSRYADKADSFDSNTLYKFVFSHDGLNFDIPWGNTSNGAHVEQYGYYGTSNQKFRIIGNGDGTYRIAAADSGRVIDIFNANSAARTGLIQWDWNGGNNQRWFIDYQGNGVYRLRSKLNGQVAEMPNASWQWADQAKTWPWNGARCQQFFIVPAR